jgi:hypothetical protein
MLDLGRSCVFDAWQGVSTACFPGDAALRGVPADGAVVAFGDLLSPSPSSMSMVSMSELIVVVSADTVDLVRFLFFFYTSAAWVAAREVEIFPAVCLVHRGATTLNSALHDVAGASLSLPTVESETYSSMGGVGAA